MKDSRIAIVNGNIFTGESLVDNQAVLVSDGYVVDLIPMAEVPADAEIIDAAGCCVAPGLIDLQIYGGGDYLFAAEPTPYVMDHIAKSLVSSGTTSFMITMATNTTDVVDGALQTLRDYRHPALLGLHLEGPYINSVRKGAHPAAYIRKPDNAEIAALLDRAGGCLRMMTIAPERFGRADIRLLRDHGVLLSAGHSDASFDEAMNGFDQGIQAVTHLFNAMSPFHHRNTGLPGAVFQSNRASASIIADGIHVDYQALAISKRLLGDRLFLITDAVVAVAAGTYTHIFKEDRYTLPDGTLSGSSLTMMQAVANCVRHAGIPLEEALRMATVYPASLIGSTDIGRIKKGHKANLVIFDDQYTITHVFSEGKRQ